MPTANINGINLYYRTYGTGEPIILISGLGSDHNGWFLQVGYFKKRYRVVVFDNRGVGRSDKPVQPYTIRDMATDTVGLMDHLGIDQANILGLSMGGMIAQEVALNYPERVKRLLLTNTASTVATSATSQPILMPETSGKRADYRKASITVIRSTFNKWPYRMLMTLAARLFTKAEMLEGIPGQIRAISGHNTMDRLHLIKCPTLIVGGTRDRLLPPGTSEALAKLIPRARLVMVKNGSHGLTVEDRKRFNREVMAFLAAR